MNFIAPIKFFKAQPQNLKLIFSILEFSSNLEFSTQP